MSSLNPSQRCKTCGGSVLQETIKVYRPGETPRELVILRCIAYKGYSRKKKPRKCPNQVLQERPLIIEPPTTVTKKYP